MPDVRKMSDFDLFDGVFQYLSVHESVTQQYIDKLAEAERRLKIMRPVCEAAIDNWKTVTFQSELGAYRAMEAERERP